jgi:hypothetical protein
VRHVHHGDLGWQLTKDDTLSGWIEADLEDDLRMPILVIDGKEFSWQACTLAKGMARGHSNHQAQFPGWSSPGDFRPLGAGALGLSRLLRAPRARSTKDRPTVTTPHWLAVLGTKRPDHESTVRASDTKVEAIAATVCPAPAPRRHSPAHQAKTGLR